MTETKRSGTLVIGKAWVGDAVMTHCCIRALANLYAERIDLVVPKLTAPIGNLMPEVTEVFTHDFAHGKIELGARRKLAKKLKSRSYARAYILPNNLKAALIPWLARIPERHGWRGEWRFGILNKIRLHRHFPSEKHEARKIAALAYPAGKDFELLLPSLEFAPQLQAQICAQYQLEPQQSWVALAVGAAHHDSGKLWPAENYAQLATLLNEAGHRSILCGSKADAKIAAKVLELLPPETAVNLTGLLSLEETASILAMCSAVIANDSGLMHLGAALGLPTLGIFGPSDPKSYYPLGKRADYLAPEQPGSISQIKLSAVLAKAKTMLTEVPASQ